MVRFTIVRPSIVLDKDVVQSTMDQKPAPYILLSNAIPPAQPSTVQKFAQVAAQGIVYDAAQKCFNHVYNISAKKSPEKGFKSRDINILAIITCVFFSDWCAKQVVDQRVERLFKGGR